MVASNLLNGTYSEGLLSIYEPDSSGVYKLAANISAPTEVVRTDGSTNWALGGMTTSADGSMIASVASLGKLDSVISGTIHLLRKTGGAWSEFQKFGQPLAQNSAYFGTGVRFSNDGTTLVAGAPALDSKRDGFATTYAASGGVFLYHLKEKVVVQTSETLIENRYLNSVKSSLEFILPMIDTLVSTFTKTGSVTESVGVTYNTVGDKNAVTLAASSYVKKGDLQLTNSPLSVSLSYYPDSLQSSSMILGNDVFELKIAGTSQVEIS